MLLRLSRLAFWLTAGVAALTLVAPAGHETVLMALVIATSALAYGLWRSALRGARRRAVPLASLPAAPVLDAAALQEVGARLTRCVGQAASFEAALHAAAQVLRSELGAREVAVHGVHRIDATHALVSDLVEARPGFRTAPRRIRLAPMPSGDPPLGEALRSGHEAGRPPGTVAVPVLAAGQVVAALVLTGLELAVEPAAFAALLACVRASLGSSAISGRTGGIREKCDTPSHLQRAGVLIVTDNAHLADESALQGWGCAAVPVSGMLVPGGAPAATQFEGVAQADGERIRELGFDDHLCRPLLPGRTLEMLSMPPQPQGTAGPELDPAALARLSELDPTGENRLIERVLQAFQTSAARLRPQAEAARAGNDRAALRLVAHTFKSSAASVGALHLSRSSAELETAIREETGAALDAQLDAMLAALDAALRAIAERLRERA